jgi:hypothetical protein
MIVADLDREDGVMRVLDVTRRRLQALKKRPRAVQKIFQYWSNKLLTMVVFAFI